MTTELTEKGMPRPVHGKLPVPWVVHPPNFKAMSPERMAEVVEQKLCQVCGEGHPRSGWVFVLVKGNEEPRGEDIVVACMDDAMLHRECAKLALVNCPALRDLQQSGLLMIYRTLAINVNSYTFTDKISDGELHLGVPLRVCQRVDSL